MDNSLDWGLIMKDSINFLLVGVGGQGIILASDILANVGLAAGYQAKQAEVHGMSQRGGSVSSHVRWGKVVYSPLVGAGEVDILLAFEKAEALRNLKQLRANALVVINQEGIIPVTVTTGGQAYPSDEALHMAFSKVTRQVRYVEGLNLAATIGNSKAANTILLGALSALMESSNFIGSEFPEALWLKVISERVPSRFVELNQRAFQAGRKVLFDTK
jgi:indolepyruvate ferredoxin oxidoreductase beta subunit